MSRKYFITIYSSSCSNSITDLQLNSLENFKRDLFPGGPYIFVSSSGIYYVAPRKQNFEKLYDIQGLKQVAFYADHVYFVADLADRSVF